VLAASFSPDGQRIVTASADGTARIWDSLSPKDTMPSWFLDAVELFSGCRYKDGLVIFSEPHQTPVTIAARFARQLQETNTYARTLRWMLADSMDRVASPCSETTVREAITRLVRHGSREALCEALAISPTNSLALAKLAALTALGSTDADSNPAEAELLSRRALLYGSKDARIWQWRAKVLELIGKPTEGLEAADEAISLATNDVASWRTKCNLLEITKHWTEAAAGYERLATLLDQPASRATQPETVPSSNSSQLDIKTNRLDRRAALLSRCRALAHAGQVEQAQREQFAVLGIPTRAPNLSPLLLDLSLYYNAGLGEDWLNASLFIDTLPCGVQHFGDVDFDVRGLIQINSEGLQVQNPGYPEMISGIPVGQKITKLNFLIGTGWPEQAGATIGQFLMTYADKSTVEAPIIYGKDVENWEFFPDTPETGTARPVWKGPHKNRPESWPREGIRLYVITWMNPRPEVEIMSLDLISTMTQSAPFVIAITADPVEPNQDGK
jgi:hypothetical protein